MIKKESTKDRQELNVLVVSHYFGAHGGGIERVAEKLIQEIASLGGFRFVWAASDTDRHPERPPYVPLPMWTLNVLERRAGLPCPLWGVRSLNRLRQAVAGADVLWLHDTLYAGNILAFLWARRQGKPVVITQHIGPVPYRNPFLRWLMLGLDRLVTRPMLKKASQAVFVSDRVAEDYHSSVGAVRAIKVIPNGVDLRLFQPALRQKRRYLREQFALKARQPVFLFAGRFVERKGLRALRGLAELLPESRFWLAGRGPINPARWLLPNVHVFSNRSGVSLAELYQAADVLVLPSYGEGFPLVIQEAMACGLPVLCGPQTAAGSFAAKPLLFLEEVYPQDPGKTAKNWASRLRNFPLELPLKEPMGVLADFAHAQWNWRPIAETYAALLRGVSRKNRS